MTVQRIILIVVVACTFIVIGDRNKFKLPKAKNEYVDALYQRCTGYCNKKYCKIYSSCRPVNRTSKLKRFDIYFHEGIVLEAPVLLNITTYKKFATQYRPLMITVKDDFCEQVSRRNHPVYAFFGFGRNRNTGNMFDPCPISGRRYLAPKYTDTWVGALIPTGEWRVDFILSKVIDGVEEHIFTESDYFLVKAKSAIEF